MSVSSIRRAGVAVGFGDSARDSQASETKALRQPDAPTRAWVPRGARPVYGGLHQLAILDAEIPPARADDAPDFSTYRVGLNNRGLLSAIARDLDRMFATSISYGFASEATEAFGTNRGGGYGFGPRGHSYSIGEKKIDRLVEPEPTAIGRRAIASFVVAHEFFHVLLRHPDTFEAGVPQPKGLRVKTYAGYRPLIELQADYLAARYLRAKGLPLEPVIAMFERQNEPASKDYPSDQDRAKNVARASAPEFDLDLFQNDIVDALAFLDFLASEILRSK
jgi:hypothetical protein